MNMKAMMFAGLGLFVAMVPTTMWISSDMRGIHAREQARLQQECDASKASRTTNAAVAAP
ncbi:MAG: hypothetical protein JWM98_2374, partial [Thermoleophilia bacterium]|nr:hypothetical protein [Thermoleophilia bacterium]